jgi:exopolysaccharide production protein ExoZ
MRDRLAVVQGMRGIAALLVVLFHARWFLDSEDGGGLGTKLFASGACGVDLFFVISGFVMVYTTAGSATGPRAAGRFLVRRWVRVWPPYVIATLVFVAALRATDLQLRDYIKAFAFYPEKPAGAPHHGYPPLFVGWSLVYEMWFYLLFGASLLAGRARWVALAALFAATLLVIPLTAGGPHLDAYAESGLRPVILAIAANPIIYDFLAGVVVGLAYRHVHIRNLALGRALALAAIAFAAWQFFAGFGYGHGPTRWAPALVAVFVLVMATDHAHPFRVPAPLVWLGDISYSLYLWHVLPIRLVQRIDDPPRGPLAFAAVLVASLALAALSYRFLERGLVERVRRALA